MIRLRARSEIALLLPASDAPTKGPITTKPHIPLQKLSIVEYSGSPMLNSSNVGLVELTVLEILQQCLHCKIKWLLALELANVGLNRFLRRTTKEGKCVTICGEGVDGEVIEPLTVTEEILTDQSASGCESILCYNMALLGFVLKRHGLFSKLQSLSSVQNIGRIDWRRTSVSEIRTDVLRYFERQSSTLALRPPPMSLSRIDAVTNFVGSIMSSRLPTKRLPPPPLIGPNTIQTRTSKNKFVSPLPSPNPLSIPARHLPGRDNRFRGRPESPTTPMTHEAGFKFWIPRLNPPTQ